MSFPTVFSLVPYSLIIYNLRTEFSSEVVVCLLNHKNRVPYVILISNVKSSHVLSVIFSRMLHGAQFPFGIVKVLRRTSRKVYSHASSHFADINHVPPTIRHAISDVVLFWVWGKIGYGLSYFFLE